MIQEKLSVVSQDMQKKKRKKKEKLDWLSTITVGKKRWISKKNTWYRHFFNSSAHGSWWRLFKATLMIFHGSIRIYTMYIHIHIYIYISYDGSCLDKSKNSLKLNVNVPLLTVLSAFSIYLTHRTFYSENTMLCVEYVVCVYVPFLFLYVYFLLFFLLLFARMETHMSIDIL